MPGMEYLCDFRSLNRITDARFKQPQSPTAAPPQAPLERRPPPRPARPRPCRRHCQTPISPLEASRSGAARGSVLRLLGAMARAIKPAGLGWAAWCVVVAVAALGTLQSAAAMKPVPALNGTQSSLVNATEVSVRRAALVRVGPNQPVTGHCGAGSAAGQPAMDGCTIDADAHLSCIMHGQRGTVVPASHLVQPRDTRRNLRHTSHLPST